MAEDKKGEGRPLSLEIDDSEAVKQGLLEQEQKSTSAMAPPQGGVTNNPVIAILSYCGSSILMTTTNKYVMSGVDFNLSFFLLAIQSIVCVLAIEISKRSGFITYRDFNFEEGKRWFPVSLLLIGMIYTSTWAIKFLSIPVYTIFKNLTIILIAYGEVIWFGGVVTPMALGSFGLMVLSSLVAAWADIKHALAGDAAGAVDAAAKAATSNLYSGYFWMGLNCLCTATYMLYLRKRIKMTNFKDFDTMFYNNLLTIPVLLACTVVLEDWSSANLQKNFPVDARNSVIAAMLISGLSAVFISYASGWCVRVTSSTTYSMVGALNKLPIALSGIVFFDAPVTFGSLSAIFIGFVSGIVYTLSKIKQNAMKKDVLPTSNGSMSKLDSKESMKA